MRVLHPAGVESHRVDELGKGAQKRGHAPDILGGGARKDLTRVRTGKERVSALVADG